MERKRAKPQKSFDKPREAQIFFAQKRAPVGEIAIPLQRYIEAMDAMRGMPLFSTRANAFVSADPSNPATLYVTCSNFEQVHVRKSTNRGATWTTITGSGATALPDIPTFALAIDPGFLNRLYVGTDLGVFASLDGGASWAVENSGFANVITESLVVDTSSKRLYAFTHGRGVWYVNLPVNTAIDPSIDLLLLDN